MSFFTRYKPPGPLKPKANPYQTRTSPFRHKLPILIFFLLLITGSFLRFHPTCYGTLSSALFEGTVFLQEVFVYPFHRTHAFVKDCYNFIHLRKENSRLHKENEALKWKIQHLQPLQNENATLREQLHIPAEPIYRHSLARTISSPYDGIHYFFLISSGTREGISKDQAVITPDGVLGRIEKVGHHVARVLLANDINSRIPVITEISQQKAILAGEGTPYPVLVYVTDVQKIQPGERIVTSGVGGTFPAGLPVGHVADLSHGKIHVKLAASYNNLEWVHILQPQAPEFQDEVRTNLEEE